MVMEDVPVRMCRPHVEGTGVAGAYDPSPAEIDRAERDWAWGVDRVGFLGSWGGVGGLRHLGQVHWGSSLGV